MEQSRFEMVQKNVRREIMFEKSVISKVHGDGDNGVIEGFASVFNNFDLDNDRMLPGAFTRTIHERVNQGKVPLMTRHVAHGGGTLDTIGGAKSAHQDDFGMFATFDLFDTEKAQENRKTAKAATDAGFPFGLSVGFLPILGKFMENDRGGVDFAEVILLETTMHPTPSNELALVTGAKTCNSISELLKVDVGDMAKQAILALPKGELGGYAKSLSLLLEAIEERQAESEPGELDAAWLNSAKSTLEKEKLAILKLSIF